MGSHCFSPNLVGKQAPSYPAAPVTCCNTRVAGMCSHAWLFLWAPGISDISACVWKCFYLLHHALAHMSYPFTNTLGSDETGRCSLHESYTQKSSKKANSEAYVSGKLLKIASSFTWKTCGYYSYSKIITA